MSEDQFKHMHHGLVSAFHVGDFEIVADGTTGGAGTVIALEFKYNVRLVGQTADSNTRTVEVHLIRL